MRTSQRTVAICVPRFVTVIPVKSCPARGCARVAAMLMRRGGGASAAAVEKKRTHAIPTAASSTAGASFLISTPYGTAAPQVPEYDEEIARQAQDWADVPGAPDALSDAPTRCAFCDQFIPITETDPVLLVGKPWQRPQGGYLFAAHRDCLVEHGNRSFRPRG
jgi:hypothetical protein